MSKKTALSKRRSAKDCPSRAAWAALGAVGAVGSLWALIVVWRRAWGISGAPTTYPEPVPAPSSSS